MSDIEFPLSEEILNKNIQKMLYLPESKKVFIWHNNKPIVIDVDLNDMAKTTENYNVVMDGQVDTVTKENLLLIISEGLAPYILEHTDNGSGNGNGEADNKTKIQIAFETVKEQAQNLFIDEYKIPHIAIPIQDHLEILSVNNGAFKNWYRMFIFERDKKVLDNQTINDLCSLAGAYAASHKYGRQINLNLRTAFNVNYDKLEWIYDLTNKNWEFIKITSNGWDIFKDEIIFRRYNNQKEQVYPNRNYEPDIFDKFMKLVNIKMDNKDSVLLLKCYIVSLFIPEIQKVVLMLLGSQGAGKSSLEELIKMLVDPSIVKTFTFPRDLNELQQQLSHNYLVYYDNISTIRPWISDELCRAVSGSGSSKRQLYTDDDDVIRCFKRGVGMNGINLAATKPDLLDRSIIIELERIEDGEQRTPEDILKSFEEIKAPLLGYILDILVKVLDHEENNPDKEFKMYRMTEFSKYGEIIARCMGYSDNEFIRAYEQNRQIQVDEIIEFSQVATTIMCMMFEKYNDKDFWDGTPSELYGEIKNIADTEKWNLNIDTSDRYWPTNVKSFGRRLNEIIPTLNEKGLKITRYEEPDKKKTRKIKIRKVLSETSETSDGDNSRSKTDSFSDETSDDIEKVSAENIDLNCAQNQVFGRRTTSDDIICDSMGDIDVLGFIKIDGTPIGDGIVFNADPAIGSILLQNNFLSGHLRMRGKGEGTYPFKYLEFIDKVFGAESNTIEVCSRTVKGRNIGESCFTVDINPECKPDLVADGQDLAEIRDNTLCRYRCDPPYNEKRAREMYDTNVPSLSQLLAEGARVVKPGSLMFLLCSQNRQSCPPNIKRIGFIYISVVPNNETRILNIYVKLPEPKSEELK
jgi:hypothetical protein